MIIKIAHLILKNLRKDNRLVNFLTHSWNHQKIDIRRDKFLLILSENIFTKLPWWLYLPLFSKTCLHRDEDIVFVYIFFVHKSLTRMTNEPHGRQRHNEGSNKVFIYPTSRMKKLEKKLGRRRSADSYDDVSSQPRYIEKQLYIFPPSVWESR